MSKTEKINLTETLSANSIRWLRDLAKHKEDTGFPNVDLRSASVLDRVILANYLGADDGSLSPSDLDFSRQVAAEVIAVTAPRNRADGW